MPAGQALLTTPGTEVGPVIATMKRPSVRLALAAALAAVAAAVYFLAIGPDPASGPSSALQVPNRDGGSAGAIMQNVRLGTPYVYQMYDVCVKSGTATITSVEATKPIGKITVSDWLVRLPEDWRASDIADGVPLAKATLPRFKKAAITSPCSAHSDRVNLHTQFAVVVTLMSPAAAANGFTIHFRDGHGRSGTAFEPFSVTECTGTTCPRLAYNAPKSG
jgi:hypothetical protein